MTERNTATEREYTPGTVLFEEDDPGEAMYVIRSGRVKIYRRSGERELVLAFLTDGEFFGEMALLENLPRSAAAMVVEPSFLIKVSAATFEEMIRRNIEIAVRIMRKLSGRVRTLDSRLEKLLLDTAVARAIEVLRWLQTQGMLEDGWIRVKDVGKHFDLGAQAGIPVTQAVFVQEQLERAGCMKFDGADLLIGEKHTLDSYVGFLELKREYGMGGDDPDPNDNSESTHRSKALRRLMGALKLSEDEIAHRQKQLVAKYERYIELKKRFKAMDGDAG